MNQLFVYGTLCPNKANAHILEQMKDHFNITGIELDVLTQ